jgi:hypothetical protein
MVGQRMNRRHYRLKRRWLATPDQGPQSNQVWRDLGQAALRIVRKLAAANDVVGACRIVDQERFSAAMGDREIVEKI